MCREGTSWLKKKRFYFIPNKNILFCHNCGYKKSTINWISEVSNLSISEILEEVNNYSSEFFPDEKKQKHYIAETLPKDSINLLDENQITFYKDNSIIKKALLFLSNRFLVNAVNKPKAFYISLVDKFHKNRIIIPFYDENGKIIHYQTRTLLESDDKIRPRYLSKINSEKSIFNIDRIDQSEDTIFIFEGPFNSCFVKNGIAVGGIQDNSYHLFSNKQEEQIKKFPFHKKIWVLDSQWIDKAAFNKTKKLLELKESVFIWPKEIGKKYKDFNDIMIATKNNHFPEEFIKKYTK